MFKYIYLLVACIFIISVSNNSWAAYPTWPSCPALTNNDFREVVLVNQSIDNSLLEPVKMAFDMNALGNVDIYFVERRGKIKKYTATTATTGVVSTLTTLDVAWEDNIAQEQGLVGIALDPNFKTNGFIYVLSSPRSTSTFRLSRFTVVASSINNATEVVMIDIPNNRNMCCHTGGGMQFDAYGDLWITIGNNANPFDWAVKPPGGNLFINETDSISSDEWGSSSTASMRGSILRISPQNDGSYTIPQGNFADYFYHYWLGRGEIALANEYLDPKKVLPEIWLKGTRNAYSLTLDPVRRWAAFGDVGPDFGGITEEFNIATVPQFAGWPYWSGNNVINEDIKTNLQKTDPSNPDNTSKWNKGVTRLPPATPAIAPTKKDCAITGPLYRYDGDLQSTVKLPPHFNRHWFLTECKISNSFTKVVKVSEDGKSLLGGFSGNMANDAQFDVFTHIAKDEVVDFQAGPDGALYLLNYAGWFGIHPKTRISRIEYTGDCRPALPKLEQPMGIKTYSKKTTHANMVTQMVFSGRFTLPAGISKAVLYDLTGRLIWQYNRQDDYKDTMVKIPSSIQEGIFLLQFR